MDILKAANLAMRFLLELGGLAALGYWGNTSFDGVLSLVVAVGAPVLMAVVWGVFVAPKSAVALPKLTKFLLGLAILEVTALALAAAGQPVLALLFGGVVLINALLIAIWQQ